MNERHLHTSSETSIICTQVSHSIYVRYVYIYIHDILQRVHKAQQIIKNANFIKWTLRKSLNVFCCPGANVKSSSQMLMKMMMID